MDGLAHRDDGTHLPVGLGEITERIYARIDRFAVDLGRDLQEAFESHRAVYDQWVETCLPFGLDKASRLRMVYLAVENLPDDVLARMPRPWQAMYALTRLPAGVLTEAVESGEIHPGLSARQSIETARKLSGRETRRHSEVDIIVGKLVGLPASALSPPAREMLDAWLASERSSEGAAVRPAR